MPGAGCSAGVINLPYAEIEEPFEAWYNLTGNKSRIQYYGGRQGGHNPYGRTRLRPSLCERRLRAGPPCLSFPPWVAQGR